jgi:hypothetical protein
MKPGVLGMLKNARNMVAKIPNELRELRTGVEEDGVCDGVTVNQGRGGMQPQ